jgi:protein-tyrosine phosphatase
MSISRPTLIEMQMSDPVLTELPYGLPGRVFRSPMPFSAYDPHHQLFERYRQEQVSTIVLLADDRETEKYTGRSLREYYASQGLQVIYLPIPDFSIPNRTALAGAVEQAHRLAGQGENIAIHCYAGRGRTGLFAACLARVVLGLSGEDAVAWVRRYVEGAVEVSSQSAFVNRFI